MPAKRVPGIGRINIRCEGWFADRVDEAAKKTGRSLASYVRIALAEQMRRDGVSTEGPTPNAPPVKKRGRPPKPKPSEEPDRKRKEAST